MSNSLLAPISGNLWLGATIMVVLQIVCYGLGLRLAHFRRRQGVNASDSLAVIAGGILGLTAFVLALTLSLATTRMQERREQGWVEANALHTAWQMAEAVDEPESIAAAALLREYLAQRRDSLRLDLGDPQIDTIAARVDQIIAEVSQDLNTLASRRTDDVMSSLLSAFNDAVTATVTERLAVANETPPQINLLMLVLVFAGMGVIGHQVGMTGQAHPVLTSLLIGIWAFIVLLIIDFGDSRQGFFRTSTAGYDMVLGMVDTSAALAEASAGQN